MPNGNGNGQRAALLAAQRRLAAQQALQGMGANPLAAAAARQMPNAQAQPALQQRMGGLLGSMKKGGKVAKTGPYKLHKGEKVVPAHKAKAAGKAPARAKKRR
jgi:hypothetical protein